jgi:hypothetical protein
VAGRAAAPAIRWIFDTIVPGVSRAVRGKQHHQMAFDAARSERGSFADALTLIQTVASAQSRSSTGWTPYRPGIITGLWP